MPVVLVGAVDILLIALLSLILAYAALLLVKYLAQLLSHVPGIGGWVNDHLVGWSESAQGWVWARFSGYAAMLGTWINTSRLWLKVSTETITALAQQTAATVWHIAVVQIPREIGDAKAWAATRIESARTYASNLAGSVLAQALARAEVVRAAALAAVGAARYDLAVGINAARAEARTDLRAAVAAVEGDLAAVDVKAVHLFQRAEADMANAVHASEAALSAAIVQVAHAAEAGVLDAENLAKALSGAAVVEAGVITDLGAVKALEGVWDDLTDAAGVIAGDLPVDLSGLEDLLKGLSKASLSSLAGVLAGLGVMSLTQALTMEKCILPNCRNLSGLGQFLEALLGGVEDAALLAFIIMMATDPRGAAGAVEDVAGPVVHGTLGGLRDLIGV